MQPHQIRFLKPLTGAKKPGNRAENLEIAHARSRTARVVHAKKAKWKADKTYGQRDGDARLGPHLMLRILESVLICE